MKLYHLTRSTPSNYDEYLQFIIRAPSTSAARFMAGERAGDEGSNTWIKPSLSSCKVLSDTGLEGVVLALFNAG